MPRTASRTGVRAAVSRRLAAVVAVVLVASTCAAVAYAAEIFRYSPTGLSSPGDTYYTGWAYRNNNRACRESGEYYGWARARYYNSDGTLFKDTGLVYTYCLDGVSADLWENGYFRSWCRHEGTINWVIACLTTRP